MKRAILILTLITLVLLTASGVCASEDAQAAEISQGDEIGLSDDNQLAEEDSEIVSVENDLDELSADTSTYSELSKEIGSGGDKNLTHAYYKYDGSSDTIRITTAGIIDGKGAIIDMAGSNIQVFNIRASGVTIKNLTIKNNNYEGDGTIYFDKSATVENCTFINNKCTGEYGTGGAVFFIGTGNITKCNFINNSAFLAGGAIYFRNAGEVTYCNFTNNSANYAGAISGDRVSVENCNFINNTARYNDGAVSFSKGNVTNCNFVNNSAKKYGGAVYFHISGEVTNCNFVNNKVTDSDSSGGAVHFRESGEVTNCNFTNNAANRAGGAIHVHDGNVTNCNFINNKAIGDIVRGGAIFFGNGNVTDCNFINNTAAKGDGGAIYIIYSGTVENCNFVNNIAKEGGAIFSYDLKVTADTCIFKTGSDTTHETLKLSPTLNVDNFMTTYNSSEKLTFDLKTGRGMPVGNGNISIKVYYKNNNSWIGDYSCLSGQGWIVDLPVGSYYAVFNTGYAGFKPIQRTIKVIPDINYYVNVTPVSTNTKTVNITAKSNIPNDIIQGTLRFILPNNKAINANYNDDGTWWAVYKFNSYGKYNINAQYTGLNGIIVNKATIEVKDTAKATVKKTTPKITAKNKSFKVKTKSKKYTVTLKNNAGKPIKKVRLTLKVKGKIFKATTDSKGKATFKITKLTKKGKFKATVKFAGNKYYNAKTVKTQIRVK